MNDQTFGNTLDTIRGVGTRKLTSWVDSFIEQTANLDAPLIWRRWVAISLIASAMTQRTWLRTSENLYPNLYVTIVGHPGVGKTRTIGAGRRLVQSLSEFHLSPISMTFASLVDALAKAKSSIVVPGQDTVTFNSMYICADEMGAFIHKYDSEMIAGLSAFYDPTPYRQTRRGNDLDIAIASPQLNILAGVTPSNLLGFIPESAWGQGYTSRFIFVFSDERILGDDFADRTPLKLDDLKHDLNIINNLWGQFHVTKEFKEAVTIWRTEGEKPVPDHPKLAHYITRRRAHLYKLSMVASVNRSNALVLNESDFFTALAWLIEAETAMPDIFKAGTTNVDGQAMDEIHHFVLAADKGQGVSEQRIIHFARERIPMHSLLRVIETMEKTGQLHCLGVDRRTGIRQFTAKIPMALN